MDVTCIWEHNGGDTLLYAGSLVGAFTRGATVEEALRKMPAEAEAYLRWAGESAPGAVSAVIVQEKASELDIRDADSDILFDSEKGLLTAEEYAGLKTLALRSAADFLSLYEAFPDKNKTVLPERKTFYGAVPRTAEEMYRHTKNVNAYYFGEIGVEADNEGTIAACRRRGFELLEARDGFLQNPVVEGSYGEKWCLRKVLRRFIWHDRIHAKAMYRMGIAVFGAGAIPDVFRFYS